MTSPKPIAPAKQWLEEECLGPGCNQPKHDEARALLARWLVLARGSWDLVPPGEADALTRETEAIVLDPRRAPEWDPLEHANPDSALFHPRRDEAPRWPCGRWPCVGEPYCDPSNHPRDEAPRCTCESIHTHQPDCPPDCHAPDCPMRDEARGAPELFVRR